MIMNHDKSDGAFPTHASVYIRELEIDDLAREFCGKHSYTANSLSCVPLR